MLEPFMGELCVHPAAIDYCGNTCSHRCAYCFAQHREAERAANPKRLIDLCFGRSKSSGLVDWLFNNGYPVCLSNRSDPFCVANEQDTAVALSALNNVRNPIYIQTKGGRRAIELLDRVTRKEVVIYVTVSTSSETIRKRIEPGAPTIKQRIELLEYAHARGWLAVCALNPLWQPWWSDSALADTVTSLAAKGITRFISQPLHLPRAKVAAPRQGGLARLTDDDVKGSTDYRNPRWEWYSSRVSDLWAAGASLRAGVPQLRRKPNLPPSIRIFPVGGLPLPCDLYGDCDPWLPKRMNATQEFTDYAYASKPRRLFSFKDFLFVMTRGNPEMLEYSDKNLYKYLLCMNRAAWKRGGLAKSAHSFTDVYRCIWNDPTFYHSPQRRECFRPVGDNGGALRDRNGDIVLFRCDDIADWREKPECLSINDLKRKEVSDDELHSVL